MNVRAQCVVGLLRYRVLSMVSMLALLTSHSMKRSVTVLRGHS